VVELETDKATIEVPSSVAGKVTEIKVKAGDKVKVGAVVLTVDSTAPATPRRSKAKAGPNPERGASARTRAVESPEPGAESPEP
jgi:pyruvate/2-oxoglutarate dehydrogenase complex dihydrolipoamide acyltransferase (E2) component